MKNPPTYTWYLPEEGNPDPEPRWRVMYGWENGNGSFPVEVCAPDEETAIMRAGMKRAEMTKLDRYFWGYGKQSEYVRLSVEMLCDCPCHDYHTGLIPVDEGKCGWCSHEVH